MEFSSWNDRKSSGSTVIASTRKLRKGESRKVNHPKVGSPSSTFLLLQETFGRMAPKNSIVETPEGLGSQDVYL